MLKIRKKIGHRKESNHVCCPTYLFNNEPFFLASGLYVNAFNLAHFEELYVNTYRAVIRRNFVK
jgi:hypothetical protein